MGMETKKHTDEPVTEAIKLLVSPTMLAEIDEAWHVARMPNRMDWLRAAIREKLEREKNSQSRD